MTFLNLKISSVYFLSPLFILQLKDINIQRCGYKGDFHYLIKAAGLGLATLYFQNENKKVWNTGRAVSSGSE